MTDYKAMLEWCLGINPKTNNPNGLPKLNVMRRHFWWHANNVEKEYSTAVEAIQAAMEKDNPKRTNLYLSMSCVGCEWLSSYPNNCGTCPSLVVVCSNCNNYDTSECKTICSCYSTHYVPNYGPII